MLGATDGVVDDYGDFCAANLTSSLNVCGHEMSFVYNFSSEHFFVFLDMVMRDCTTPRDVIS